MPGVSTSLSQPAPGGGAPLGPQRIIGNAAQSDLSAKMSRLHLGCGKNLIAGWANIDGDIESGADMILDFRSPLPFSTNSVTHIYSEHLFEHFPLQEGIALMAECHRVLKPGGVMRTAMPDLYCSVVHYLGRWKGEDWVNWFPEIDTPARAFNMTMRSWGHEYLYDFEDFSCRLRQVGFKVIERMDLNASPHPELCGLETRKESELIVEATKTTD